MNAVHGICADKSSVRYANAKSERCESFCSVVEKLNFTFDCLSRKSDLRVLLKKKKAGERKGKLQSWGVLSSTAKHSVSKSVALQGTFQPALVR